ncbi:MAG: HU family DNA-binding protein [Bacteroidaceae bacterium]|nr:HU family DNA-binding protein [Bacteroidaceae bacterium]
MNNKDFITAFAARTGLSNQDAQQTAADIVAIISEQLEDDNVVVVPGFGSFEVKKKMERVVVNPTTRQRMLVPPKLVVNFRSASTLKDKMQ